MRPSRHLIIRKKPKKKISHKRKNDWGLRNNITNMELNNLNEIILFNKSRLAKGTGSWKVVPKDSCEVYKDRRKRKLEAERRKEEDRSPEEIKKKDTRRREYCRQVRCSKRITRRQKKYSKSHHDDSSISSYSSNTRSSTSCSSSCMDYE